MDTSTSKLHQDSLRFELIQLASLNTVGYDGIIYVSNGLLADMNHSSEIKSALEQAARIDNAFETNPGVYEVNLPARRLVFSPTGPTSDQNEVRMFIEAAKVGVGRAITAGVRTPLLALMGHKNLIKRSLIILLGYLEALHKAVEPNSATKIFLEALHKAVEPNSGIKIFKVGVWSNQPSLASLMNVAVKLEAGRILAGEISGDPVWSAREKIEKAFTGSCIQLSVLCIPDDDLTSYPLVAAYTSSEDSETNQGEIIHMSYSAPNPQKSIFLLGIGSWNNSDCVETGEYRSKFSVASVAGFMKIVSVMKPDHVNVIGVVCMLKSSGKSKLSPCQVIPARSEKKVMVRKGVEDLLLADLLCEAKEKALEFDIPTQIFTITSRTGQAHPYSIIVDNGPALEAHTGENLQKAGNEVGDMFEVLSVKQDDFELPTNETNVIDDTALSPGVVGTAKFLMLGSDIDAHGSGSKKPIPYSHINISGSPGNIPYAASRPIMLAFSNMYLRLDEQLNLVVGERFQPSEKGL